MTTMQSAQERWFGPFRLDVQDARLWQGAQALRLRPKSFAVLRYLLERPGRLVAKAEVLDGGWPGLVVGADARMRCLRVCAVLHGRRRCACDQRESPTAREGGAARLRLAHRHGAPTLLQAAPRA